MKINYNKIKKSSLKSLKGLWDIFPILIGIILLISIINNLIPKTFYKNIFTGNMLIDSFIGDALGSVLTGNPITGYIIGKGFLDVNISLIAITSFLVSWTTVGFIQLPAESLVLGKKFAIYRNIGAFIISIFVSITTVFIYNLIS